MDYDSFLTSKMVKRGTPKKKALAGEKALLDLSFLPNEEIANDFATEFLNGERVIIMAFTRHNFAMTSSDAIYPHQVDAILFIDLQCGHPEIWLCAGDGEIFDELFTSTLQVFLISCAKHDISVHLRAHIDFGFFEQYFEREEG